MDEYNLMDMFRNFKWDHRDKINKKLLETYKHYYSDDTDLAMKSGKFGAFVGIPLFVVWLIWANTFETTREQLFPALVLIILGFCVRYYTKAVVTDAYRLSFRTREYKDVLVQYVEQCWLAELNGASDAEKEVINMKYDYFRKQIVFEDFPYYDKPKKR